MRTYVCPKCLDNSRGLFRLAFTTLERFTVLRHDYHFAGSVVSYRGSEIAVLQEGEVIPLYPQMDDPAVVYLRKYLGVHRQLNLCICCKKPMPRRFAQTTSLN